jgi:HPt (histidine-containing phosphotransfer) domain-containing protein
MKPANNSSFESPIDRAALLALRRELELAGSFNFQEAVQTYLETAAQYMADLQQAVVQYQADRIKQLAHLLKGSSSYFGARGMVILCQRMELLAKANQLEDMPHFIDNLFEEFTRVRRALEEESIRRAA